MTRSFVDEHQMPDGRAPHDGANAKQQRHLFPVKPDMQILSRLFARPAPKVNIAMTSSID
ncbi:hypothetical protein [Variovorax sp. YR216]|uniref:hypothetical protein n=1 Tax=Variovorax sp. YR216 TaxID=1882828 RepID=UPI00115F8961|nr:hypothetical protein [Variovorax sp. YR216]